MNGKEKRVQQRTPTCYGCRTEILDQYILQVAPDMEWHASCLKCVECQQFLDESCTCFVKDRKTYCKKDYMRLFGAKCAKCSESFDKNDFVMRARNKIYHTECFCCEACTRQLVSGDEFAVRDDRLFCEVCIRSTVHPLFSPSCDSHDSSQTQLPTIYDGKNPPVNGGDTVVGQTIVHENRSPSEHTILSSTRHHHHHREERSGRNHNNHNGHHKGNSDHKPTRVRTVLNEKQLHTLRSCYQQNPRPDALMKEQLVEMTGLSPRVIRVWFQNKRCKDKKRSILMKQIQQQEKDGRQLQNIVNMRGVPLVATSPVRHDSPVQHPLDVQSYHPPWKAFTDYALHHDVDPNAPHFQHLVNQMHGYDVGLPPGPPPPGSADPHLVTLHGPHPTPGSLPPSAQPGSGRCSPTTLSYLQDHDLHNPHSNLSSQIPGTPSELSSSSASE